jgi:uncharacterized protein
MVRVRTAISRLKLRSLGIVLGISYISDPALIDAPLIRNKFRFMKPEPLTDAEFERLNSVLARFGDKHSMNLEMLDGFLAALICGPDNILPSEYLPVIWGDKIVLEDTFNAQPLLHDFIALIMRHWTAVVGTLRSGEVYLPLLLEDENGISHANDWANGFLRGMDLRKENWTDLLNDEQHGGWLVPILSLAHEHNLDAVMRPYKEPVSTEMREKLIVGAAAGVMGIYRHFNAKRCSGTGSSSNTSTFRRTTPKIGCNDPCPCGSGKKFMQCSGKVTLH